MTVVLLAIFELLVCQNLFFNQIRIQVTCSLLEGLVIVFYILVSLATFS